MNQTKDEVNMNQKQEEVNINQTVNEVNMRQIMDEIYMGQIIDEVTMRKIQEEVNMRQTFNELMAKRGLKKGWVIKQLDMSWSTFLAKLKGERVFTYDEMKQIKNVMSLTEDEFRKLFPF